VEGAKFLRIKERTFEKLRKEQRYKADEAAFGTCIATKELKDIPPQQWRATTDDRYQYPLSASRNHYLLFPHHHPHLIKLYH
jgi:hypothetical protein